MPSNLNQELDWFFENFDVEMAATGEFEPSPGISDEYDDAIQFIEGIKQDLVGYRNIMCRLLGQGTKSTWRYINTEEDAREKYLIELPAAVNVPFEFEFVSKRGSGRSEVIRYVCPHVNELVQWMECAIDKKNEGKSLAMKMVFAKFAARNATWNAAIYASAMLGKFIRSVSVSLLAHQALQHYLNTQMLLDR